MRFGREAFKRSLEVRYSKDLNARTFGPYNCLSPNVYKTTSNHMFHIYAVAYEKDGHLMVNLRLATHKNDNIMNDSPYRGEDSERIIHQAQNAWRQWRQCEQCTLGI